MLNIGPQELLIILVIALVVVGPQRLPALGRSIGRGLREFRRAQDEVKRTIRVTLDEDEPPDGERRTSRAPSAAAPPSTTTRPGGDAPSTATPPGEDEATEERAQRSPPPTRVRRDPTPSASEPLPATEVREVTRTLGRSLAELRKAREEIQRSFRVDLSEPPRPGPGGDEPAEPPADGPD